MTASGAGDDDPFDAELRADALDVAGDVVRWTLAPARWDAVATAVAGLHDALRAGDPDGVRDAVTELELLGPVRATSIGAAAAVPAPEPVREEISSLVHGLTTERYAGPGGSSGHDVWRDGAGTSTD